MKIKDIIKHLETLDQEKEWVILGTDPTDWDYGLVIEPNVIQLESVFPCEDNGLFGNDEDDVPLLEMGVNEDGIPNEEVECYVTRINCQAYKIYKHIFTI